MILKKWQNKPEGLLQVGFAFLGIASLAKWLLVPGTAGLPEDWTDGVTGFLYGISIGCMLLGIRRIKRGDSGAPRC